ncbi:hypothetical protein QE152_g250 [Popillia japonica]|uniref:Myb-like domain-containing protein n=1 Tax=Popillia japonica TaxID=7064 RepID=A0AAW1NKX3_POPJA
MKKGRFRPEEDAVIMEYMQVIKNSGNQFSALSKILNRPRSAIEKRYRTIQRQTHSIKPKDYAVFIKTLVAVAGCNNLFELKDRSISDEEWTKVAQILNFKKRNLQVCWMASLYTKLFHHGPINVDDIMSNLIEKLYEEEEDDYRNLNWTELALPFKNVTGAFLYRLFKRTRQTVVPLHLHKNLRKTIVAMKTKYGKNKEVMPQIDNIVIKLINIQSEINERLSKVIELMAEFSNVQVSITELEGNPNNWKLTLKTREIPTYNELMEFLVHKASALANLQSIQQYQTVRNVSVVSVHVSIKTLLCFVCIGNHQVYNCTKFLEIPVKKPIEHTSNTSTCLNCFRVGHQTKNDSKIIRKLKLERIKGQSSCRCLLLLIRCNKKFILVLRPIIQLGEET